MLCLSRRMADDKKYDRTQCQLRINGNILITILHATPSKVRIGVEAPDDVEILREDEYQERLGNS